MPKGQNMTTRYYSEVSLKKNKKKKTQETEKFMSQASPEKCPSFV